MSKKGKFLIWGKGFSKLRKSVFLNIYILYYNIILVTKEDESEILYNYFSKQYRDEVPLKDLIIRSLKLIGCPAHYSDITEKVREIGGEKI